MDFETISFFYGLGYLTPNIEWYTKHGFINSDQYKQITGKDLADFTNTVGQRF